MSKWRFVISLFVLCVGCSVTFPHNLSLIKHKNLPKPLDANLCADHNAATSVTRIVIKNADSYRVEKFVFVFRNTKNRKNNKVEGEYWHLNGNRSHRRLVVLIPGTGDRVSTSGSPELLIKSGFNVLRFFAGIDIFDKSALIEKTILTEDDLRAFVRTGKNVIRLRACDLIFVINYFNSLHYDSVGISGVSLGGIHVHIIGALIPQAQSELIMISGGNIAGILYTSSEKKIIEIRNLVRDKFLGSEQRMWQILGEELWDIDPLRFAQSLNPSKMRIIANYWDNIIRYKFAKEMWHANGKPDFEVILFPPGHYGSALLLWIPMIRYELRCAIWPICFPIPWSIARVPEINKQFFKEKLPQ